VTSRAGDGATAGTWTLVRVRLRADRWALLAWVVSAVALFAGTASSVASLYGTPDKRQGYADAVSGNPAFEAINGIPYGADTLGGIVADEWAFLGTVLVPLLAVSLVARGTRREEEDGLLELVRSRGVGRAAQLAAVGAVVAGCLVVVAVGMGASLVAVGVPGGPSATYAASYLGLGLVWLGVAALAAQVVRRARGVWALGLGALVGAYVLRAVGDVSDGAAWLRWASPLAWLQETRAFAADHRTWPLLLPVAGAAVLLAAAAVLVGRRDLGAGLVASRSGPAHASALLASPLGLAVRRAVGTAGGWCAIALIVGGVFGALAKEAASAVSSSSLGGTFATGSEPADGYLALTVEVVALLACAAAVQGVGALRDQETAGLAEETLARPVGRRGWALGDTAAALATALVVLVVGGLAAGAGAAVSLGEPARTGALTAAALGYLPAVLVCAGVALALFGLAPRAQQAAWAVVAWAAVVAMLGDALDVAGWARDLSPLDHLGALPVDGYDATAAAWLVAVAVALGAVGLETFRRRDVPA